MKICFATHNSNKLKEVQEILKQFEIFGLDDIGCKEEIPETGSTLVENSKIKAEYVWQTYKISCFADDTGLEVDALNGAPGVYSARYAGDQKNNSANIELLLKNLKSETIRSARFKTVITLILNGEVHLFEGVVEGNITDELKGNEGFGYDPVFIPDGYDRTFAEMSSDEKNAISHRGRAIAKLVDFLNDIK